MRGTLLPAVMLLVLGAGLPAAAGEGPGAGVLVLETGSPWRCFVVRGSELARKASGQLAHLYEFEAKKVVKADGKRATRLNEVAAPRYTAPPPPGWRSPDFDDGSWARNQGPLYTFALGKYGLTGQYLPVALVCLRGKFRVENPAAVRGLRLEVEFEGGAAVYLNGRELARKHLPAGELKPGTPAEDYPKEAFLAPDGQLLRHKYGDPAKYADRYRLRSRSLSAAIPASALRKGVNVLCVELHRAPAPEAMFVGRTKSVHPRPGAWWNRAGLKSLRLAAAGGPAPAPNRERPAGLQVWTPAVLKRLTAGDWGDPNEPLRPLRIQAARNGAFSGKVAVGSGKPIAGLKASVTDLQGPAKIPASSISVRFARPDGYRRHGRGPRWFDSLEEFPPVTVPVEEGAGGAVQPVWVTVNVPPDAKPGDYSGKLKIGTAGSGGVEVPVELNVADWKLPDSREFITHVGLIQSPESLAMQYGVPLWSEGHWKQLERTFRLLGQVGTKTVYLTMVRRTHFGNEHGMVRWRKAAGGKLTPDFSIAEKYLKLAVRHLGKVPVVGVYCWEPPGSEGHFGRYKPKDRDILISVLDGAGGGPKAAQGPEWGTPECQEFWNTAFKGMSEVLARHGLEKSMMFAMAGDYLPTGTAAGQLHKAAPQATWAVQCHPHRPKVHEVPAGYLCCVWGVFGTRDPALPKDYYGNNRYYGWRNPFRITAFPRAGNPIYEVFCNSPITCYRFMGEGALVAAGRPNAKPPGVRGFGRVGADFWKVLKGKGGRTSFVCGRYPETAWGQLNLAYSTPYVLAPGRDGAIATTRFEMMREGLQEAEARVFIERALLDPAARARLGEELAGRCQELLDERVRTFIRAAGSRGKLPADWTWYFCSDPQRASRELYRAAAGVAAKLGKP